MGTEHSSKSTSPEPQSTTGVSELTANELDAVSGGTPTSLTPDAITAYCSTRLQSIDQELNQKINQQQGGQGHDQPWLHHR